MPDSKGEELRILIRFEVSTEVRGERFADQNITGMQGNIGKKKNSEETQVVIRKNKNIYMWGRSHETCMPQCLGQYGDQDRQSAVSLLLWRCITYKAVGKLVPVEGNMNSEKYI